MAHTPRTPAPCEQQIQRVMRELGFDYLQARSHVRSLQTLRAMPDPRWRPAGVVKPSQM